MGEVKYCLCAGSISPLSAGETAGVQMEGDHVSVSAALLNQPSLLRAADADAGVRGSDCHVLQSFQRGKLPTD